MKISSILLLITALASCKTLPPALECVKAVTASGWFSKGIKDTAYLKICNRIQREETLNKLLYQKVYLKDKDGKFIIIDGKPKYYLIPSAEKLTVRQKLIYIETGQAP